MTPKSSESFKKPSHSNGFPSVCLPPLCRVSLFLIQSSSYHFLHCPNFLKLVDCMNICNPCEADGDFVAEVQHI